MADVLVKAIGQPRLTRRDVEVLDFEVFGVFATVGFVAAVLCFAQLPASARSYPTEKPPARCHCDL